MLRLAAAAALCVAVARAFPATVYGVDVSEPVSESAWACLKADNLTFASIRCYHSYGAVDTNVVATAANAHSAGLDRVGSCEHHALLCCATRDDADRGR
jgi:hypothetical protein